MKQAVLRKTLTGDWEGFQFAKKARSFFVKNFTDGNIFVSFKDNDDESESFKISTGMAEEVAICFNGVDADAFRADTLYIKGTGEVEVEALDIFVITSENDAE